MREPFRSQKYILTIGIKSIKYKIFQIMYSRRDGSIFVSFPYFKYSEGLVSLVNYPGNIGQNVDLSLMPGGKVTAHRVKYSHHPDGKAHFSQDGKVITTIRKQSVPLEKLKGHIFTLSVQGMKDFDTTVFNNPLPTDKLTVISFQFPDTEPESIKIVARWYRIEDIEFKIIDKEKTKEWLNMWWPVQLSDGRIIYAFPIAPPLGNPLENYLILLTCESKQSLGKKQDSALLFVGGFDEQAIANDLKKDTTFLALSYPASNYKDALRQIGSIDYINI